MLGGRGCLCPSPGGHTASLGSERVDCCGDFGQLSVSFTLESRISLSKKVSA